MSTARTDSFAPAFLAGEPRATALLDDGFRRGEAWHREVRARRERRVEPALLDAFATEHNGSDAQRRNLAALAETGTVAVVTGQQIGLFLGPLYTFYKAATCIAWARAIAAETGAPCVPIFWLQTEDHDFAEIASCSVPGIAEPLALPLVETRASVAVAVLPKEIDALVAQLAEALAALPGAGEVMALVRAAYVPGRRNADAFAALLSSIFADEGLLILDPRCEAVAQLSAPLYRTALLEAGAIDAALLARGEALSRSALAEKVHVRAGSPLLFFHPEGPAGPRYRLQRAGEGTYRLDGIGGAVTLKELLAIAGQEPLRFSTSALLRPVVQDALLPSVAYVGGPAELGYLAQAAALYPLFGVRPALAVPRARFRIVDARSASLLRELQLPPAELEVPRDALLARLGAARAGTLPVEELTRKLLGSLPEQLTDFATQSPALARAARRTRLSVERAVSRFAARHARLLAAQDTALVARVDRLQATLFPGGAPQERVHSLPFYAARHGLAALKACVLAAVQPGSFAVQDLTP